jgi:hypothetical protein
MSQVLHIVQDDDSSFLAPYINSFFALLGIPGFDERREGEKERNSPSLCTHPWRGPTSS